ncbi:MAG: DUF4417 domain-containing protein [Lentisphaeria bacterium]|jgi:hypothetical protein|nr:DUF4417 domain-containing protein [Lentisphaeria bacterium]
MENLKSHYVGARDPRAGRRRTRRCVIDDGFNSELVETAFFEGTLEMPRLEAPKEIVLPERLIPFTKRNGSTDFSETLVFYEQDVRFSGILQKPEAYIDDFRRFRGIVSPDFSLYRDMPLQAQMNNVYRNRALGCFFQRHGIYVIPNVRWGDERSYTTAVLPECFAFLGVPKHSIVSVGTFGCIQGEENTRHFRDGLAAMLDHLEPEIVLVYGAMPDQIFAPVADRTRFVRYPDWISLKKGGCEDGNR